MLSIDLIGILSGIEHPGKFSQTGYQLGPSTLLMENLLVIGLRWGYAEVHDSDIRKVLPAVCRLSALTTAETSAAPG